MKNEDTAPSIPRISEELSHIGCVEVDSTWWNRTMYREFSRPGFYWIIVMVRRGKFEWVSEHGVGVDSGMRDWVTVEVAQGRPLLWEYLLDRLTRRTPPPSPGPSGGIRPGR